jgi:hypothetical protein
MIMGQSTAKKRATKGPLNARMTGPNYFDPAWHPYYNGTDEHTMQSVTKTVTSATIGVAMARGAFKTPLSTPVMHYFDETKVKNLDARKRRMSLRDLLTMTSGLDWNEDLPYDDPANPSDLMEASDDWVQFVIDRPMKEEPGTVFAYSSGATELLAYIFKRETGSTSKLRAQPLAGPLASQLFLEALRSGSSTMRADCTARRIWPNRQLYLNDGRTTADDLGLGAGER